MSEPENETNSTGSDDANKQFWYEKYHHLTFIMLLLVTLIMTIGPWIFFGVVFRLDGIEMHGHAAKVVYNNPQDLSFFVTSISNVITMIITYLFSQGVANVAQKRIVYEEMDISYVSFLNALKNRAFRITFLLQGRYPYFLIVTLYVIIFNFVTPGITALLLPHPFSRNAPLNGTELDFASSDTDCINWFNSHNISDSCDWTTYKNFSYTDCLGENQLVDVLESGRGSMLSLISNNTVSLTFTQLGAVGGLHFLGTTGGVLPIGPNGIPAFNTLLPSPLSDNAVNSYLSYNYSLDLQGISSNVSCEYRPSTHATIVSPKNTTGIYAYSGTCPPGQQDILPGLTYVIKSNNSLGFWACQSSQSENAYDLYFRGINHYAQGIGNITCTVAHAQPALHRLNYAGLPGVFSMVERISTSPNTSTELITSLIKGLGAVVSEAQNSESNLVAESVITFGVKDFGQTAYNQSHTYLRLYQAMIQGILDYQATYVRLIYSTNMSTAPSSCIRNVTGTASYEVFGWEAETKTAAYLLLPTLVNLTTLALFAGAMFIGDEGKLPRFDPTDPESVILSSDQTGNLLRASIAEPNICEPGKTKVAFGKGKDKDGCDVVRLWVPAEQFVAPP